MKDLKIRASAMANITALDRKTTITERQKKTLEDLKMKIQLTEAQAKERDRLQKKLDAPPSLSEGGKTYVKDIFHGKKFNFEKRFTNKYTQKGNAKETKAIHEAIKYLGLPLIVKNEKFYENEYTKGTPDMIFKSLKIQMDTKCPFYPSGLKSFEEKPDRVYIEQQHCYNWMLGFQNGFVCKILLNPPEEILEKEAYILMKEAGLSKMTDSFFNDVRDLYNFEKLPIQDRIKLFKVETTSEDIKRIKNSVIAAREYYAELEEKFENKNKSEIKFIKSL